MLHFLTRIADGLTSVFNDLLAAGFNLKPDRYHGAHWFGIRIGHRWSLESLDNCVWWTGSHDVHDVHNVGGPARLRMGTKRLTFASTLVKVSNPLSFTHYSMVYLLELVCIALLPFTEFSDYPFSFLKGSRSWLQLSFLSHRDRLNMGLWLSFSLVYYAIN
jgi:hypothetical protein